MYKRQIKEDEKQAITEEISKANLEYELRGGFGGLRRVRVNSNDAGVKSRH